VAFLLPRWFNYRNVHNYVIIIYIPQGVDISPVKLELGQSGKNIPNQYKKFIYGLPGGRKINALFHPGTTRKLKIQNLPYFYIFQKAINLAG
jgi:hypothetical protein